MCKLLKTKNKIILVCICLIFAGCSYTPYRYTFSLIAPESKTMDFEDNNVQFIFAPSPENIRVTIKNKTGHDISLVRDKAEYIDYSGESRMVHYGYDYVQEVRNYADSKEYVSPIRIKPGPEITGYVWINIWPDFCIGEDRHSIQSYQINYLMEPLFPKHSFEGRGEDLKGSTFKLVLPIDFGEYMSNYSFTFMINDVANVFYIASPKTGISTKKAENGL